MIITDSLNKEWVLYCKDKIKGSDPSKSRILGLLSLYTRGPDESGEPLTLPDESGLLYQNKKSPAFWDFYLCTLEGTRTPDPLIKSQLLYQLSYECGSIYGN